MGNSSTKEERRPSPTFPRTLSGGRAGSSGQPSPAFPDGRHSSYGDGRNPYGPDAQYMSDRRANRELASLFGIPPPGSAEAPLERRRETKPEREAKRLERERVNRERERERSIREESVDGGYLVTQGVYTGIEDFSKPVVRQLMIERRLAPFWNGLNDHSDSWTEHQLVAAVRGLPVPAADEVPELTSPETKEDTHEQLSEQTMKNLTVPIAARTQSSQSESSQLSTSTPNTTGLSASPPMSSGLLRGRAKTLASLTTSSKANPNELQPREMHLPKDANVNGQPIEAHLYKDASECPICFLYYPPYLNRTRCCDQPICSECFVQIKRPDPHPPEHPDPNDPQHANEQAQEEDGQLVSEPAQCPYCAQPEFGVTFESLPFRRGLTYVNQPGVGIASSTAMSSSSSLASGQLSPSSNGGRRRATSLAANAPQVISTDRVRPDWATKLASARAHQARRSAAATALHTAAYMMNGRNGSGDRGFPGFGRRVIMRRGTGDSIMGPPGYGGERYRPFGDPDDSQSDQRDESSPTGIAPPRGSSRRNRVDDLEEMMMMEAIRLSLASEEDRRKKEDKEARKDAKKKAKEDKKADKAARKAGIYPSSANPSAGTLGSSSASLDSSSGKGKSIARDYEEPDYSQLSRSAPHDGGSGAQSYLERSRAQLKPEPGASGSVPYRPSHLRNLSNVSSDASSVMDSETSPAGGHRGDGSPAEAGSSTPANADLEPLFNFRSLAAMIGEDDEKGGTSEHFEDARAEQGAGADTKTHLGDDLLPDVEEEHPLTPSTATLTPENVQIATAIQALDAGEGDSGRA